MPHHAPLISTIVVGLVLAFALGAVAHRFRLSPLIGYLLAGVLAGPFTPGYVADQGLANQLAEIGVILLMFGVGLHFSLKDLLSVKAIAIPGAVVQIASATALGIGLAWLMGWSIGAGLAQPLFGLVLIKADVELKTAQRDEVVVNYRQTVQAAFKDTHDALVANQTTRDALAAQTERKNKLQRALDLANDRYKSGRRKR